MRATAVLIVCLITVVACDAEAGSVLDRVRERGVVTCGGFARPGLAQDGGSEWRGLEVDVCRAIAAAVLGDAEKISFHGYAAGTQAGDDDVRFLTGSEIAAQNLSGRIVPGPVVFVQSHAVMVPASAAEQHLADLPPDGGVCFLSGSPVERSLPAFFERAGKNWRPLPYSEDGEMIDAYNVRRCHALAGELTFLAAAAQDRGINNLASRILPEPLAVFPLLATTGTADGEWSAVVAWTVATLVAADTPPSQWNAGGAGAMPARLAEFGLDEGWQARVIAAVGTYRSIFDRNLGAGSPLKLPPGFNAPPAAGGLLLAPTVE